MNKVYDLSKNTCSNNGIYEAFYSEVVVPSLAQKNTFRGALEGLKKLGQILTGAVAKRLATVAGAALSILAIVGVAGSIQHGKISLLGGILVAAVCLGVEYLCLKKLEKSDK